MAFALPSNRPSVVVAPAASARGLYQPAAPRSRAEIFHETKLIPSRLLAVRLSLVAVVSVTWYRPAVAAVVAAAEEESS